MSQRRHVILELVETEEKFVEDLNILIEVCVYVGCVEFVVGGSKVCRGVSLCMYGVFFRDDIVHDGRSE